MPLKLIEPNDNIRCDKDLVFRWLGNEISRIPNLSPSHPFGGSAWIDQHFILNGCQGVDEVFIPHIPSTDHSNDADH